MKRDLRWYDFLSINIYWLGLTSLAQTMTPLVVPLLVQHFVGDESKGAFYGTLRLWTLMTALLVQSLVGMISDRSTSRLGRRRPFIFASALLDVVLMAGIGLIAGLSGSTGYWALFFLMILLSAATNIGHAAQQGLIPDLVPENLRGRFSGVKTILEVPLPLVIIPFTVGRLISQGNLWAGILVAMAIILITMLITMLVPEKPRVSPAIPLDWRPFLRLVWMTGLFLVVILAVGFLVRAVGQALGSVKSVPFLLSVMGIVGLGSMVFAIGLGVIASIHLGLGRSAVGNRSFIWWVINRLAFLVGVTNLGSFAIYFLQARLGYVREQAAGPATTLIMFVGIFVLLTALPSGWLADRYGRKQMVGMSGLLAALGTLVAILAPSLSVIYVGGCLIGAGTGLFYSSNWALGTSLVPQADAGRFLGISNLAGAGAGAIGAYIGGPIADLVTLQAPGYPGLGYVLLFAIYGSLFLLSIFALRGVEEPLLPRDPSPSTPTRAETDLSVPA